jgi:phosphonoacetaldehyde hydrolase
MGLAKKDHIRKLLEEPYVTEKWTALHHAPPRERDVESLYARFEPQMMEVLAGYASVISGVVDAVEAMRARGMKIAGTTGYTRPMLDSLEALAARQGYRTDRSLAPEDAGGGRPFPWMCYRLAIDLRIYPLSACVKIGDTESDIAEGLNAGMWTIGVTRSGNAVGLSEDDWLKLDHGEQEKLLACAEQDLRSAGAHYTAETVAYTLPILDEIAQRIAGGERPI